MPKVAIIIVNWNGMKYLPDLFESLAKVDYPKESWQIFFVDNASSDNSVEWVRENYPYAFIIKNPLNFGFAKGNNIGMQAAISPPHQSHQNSVNLSPNENEAASPSEIPTNTEFSKDLWGGKQNFDYIYLLNQDTVVDPRFIKEAVLVGESDASIGAIQSFIRLWPEKHLLNSSGNKLHFLGFSYCGDCRQNAKDVYEKLSRGHTTHAPIATASGAGVMFRTSVLKEVGLLDEDLYLYHEDVDLSLRIRLAGFKIVCALKSVIYHKYEFSRSITKYYWMERNRVLVWLKNLSYPTLILLLPGMLAAEIGLLAFSFWGGFWREKLKVYSYFKYKQNWSDIFKKHNQIQATRKISDREIIKSFTDKIENQEVESWFTRNIANPLCKIYFKLIKKVFSSL